MKEMIVKKLNPEEPALGLFDKETNQLLYRLDLQSESLWKKKYSVKNQDDELIGGLKYKHEAFRLAKMPKIWGHLGDTEVFCVKREIEALQDGLAIEGDTLKMEGNILKGQCKLFDNGELIAAFHRVNGELLVSIEREEPLVVLFAFALECF